MKKPKGEFFIKIAVAGYGNLGKSIIGAVANFPDIELTGVFTRRDPKTITDARCSVFSFDDILNYKKQIDVLIITFGSSNDLEENTIRLAEHFNTVDSFDMHNRIGKYRERLNNVAGCGNHLSLVSTGWDPGLMSLARLYFASFMPYANVTSIWGEGVSQGHSEALRNIDGVKYAIQYTVPLAASREAAYRGEFVSAGELHKRVCYVVCEKNDRKRIAEQIKNTEGYFRGYETEIYFITEDEFFEKHTRLYHKGEVISVGKTGDNTQLATFSLKLDSNPDFTANILLASARAVDRLHKEGAVGAISIFDIPPRFFIHGEYGGML
ncbi:MAG: diaminopimelate dehydrogenase [Clostridia bacterium]|nr:diaminopimelate dehydrogenase [Clostridia bacterium]